MIVFFALFIFLIVMFVRYYVKRAVPILNNYNRWLDGFEKVQYNWFIQNVRDVMGEPSKIVETDDTITWYYGISMTLETFYFVFNKGNSQLVNKVHFEIEKIESQESSRTWYTIVGQHKFLNKAREINVGMTPVGVKYAMEGEQYERRLDIDRIVWIYNYGSQTKNLNHHSTLKSRVYVWFDMNETEVLDVKILK